MFAWLRPNDLVWNYWVNNYLLGQDPPAFDILAWNADTTRLSSAFHHQILDMVAGNQLVHPGAMTVLGHAHRHLAHRPATRTWWPGAPTTSRRGTPVTGPPRWSPAAPSSCWCSSGHIQTVVADPKHPGLGYYLNPETPPEAEQWLARAERHEGSWWEHWAGWLGERSGEQIDGARRPSAAPASRPRIRLRAATSC